MHFVQVFVTIHTIFLKLSHNFVPGGAKKKSTQKYFHSTLYRATTDICKQGQPYLTELLAALPWAVSLFS